jgi:hypothetical protein
MRVGLNQSEGVTVVINHLEGPDTPAVTITNCDNKFLSVRWFGDVQQNNRRSERRTDRGDYTECFFEVLKEWHCSLSGAVFDTDINKLATRLNSIVKNK